MTVLTINRARENTVKL